VLNFGLVPSIVDSEDQKFTQKCIDDYTNSLVPKFIDYLNAIPENMTYSILPVLRGENADGSYKSVTATNSIKITRFTSYLLLAERIVYSIKDILLVYKLHGEYLDLLIMGRP
jgi:hypothetical protein